MVLKIAEIVFVEMTFVQGLGFTSCTVEVLKIELTNNGEEKEREYLRRWD